MDIRERQRCTDSQALEDCVGQVNAAPAVSTPERLWIRRLVDRIPPQWYGAVSPCASPGTALLRGVPLRVGPKEYERAIEM